ncbi:MAG: CoB--CoM heterodisulfide reductase iron-sulfur subunit B family protein [Promethearchaeota archaeon]
MTETELPEINKALFLGCVIPARIPFIEKSAKVACKLLGINLNPMKGAACCPDPIGINSVDEKTWITLASRNVTIAESMPETQIMGLCSGCVLTLKTANVTMKRDPHLKKEVNGSLSKINKEFKGSIETVRHFVQVVYEEIGLEKLKSMVKKKLTKLKIAVHYGCHFIRPSEMVEFDDPFLPHKLDDVIRALGAESVDYTEKMLCCGTGVANASEDISTKMNQKKYKSAEDAGANAICVVCPSCYQKLEGGQRNVKKMFGETYKFPVFYITDLIALALGATPDEIGMKFHRPSPKKLLQEMGLQE